MRQLPPWGWYNRRLGHTIGAMAGRTGNHNGRPRRGNGTAFLRRRRTWRRPPPRSLGRGLLLTTLVALVGAGLLFLTGGVVAVSAGLGLYNEYTKDLPEPEQVGRRQVFKTSRIYDRNGVLLYEVFDPQGGRRTPVPLDDIPQPLIDAVISTEDVNFYENPGFDLQAVVRAAYDNFI